MNFNFSSILSNSMRMLNIANKAIPLIKEISPTIQNVKTKIANVKGTVPKINVKKSTTPLITNKDTSKKIVYQNNSLTFFK